MTQPPIVAVTQGPVRVPRAALAPLSEPAVDSARLLHGQREVLIRHGNEVYRLRHTRNDKLILTK
ncbi:MAG TPA: hemin uptake protein HemP [Luteimonas sp.]|nr:hemin uptake protein HemP [Luteimonas sp.]